MSVYLIEGVKRIEGTVTPSGNKNEALPTISACLLTPDPVILKRVPKIKDVLTLCEILSKLGVLVEWLDEQTLRLEAKDLISCEPNKELCSLIRASILLIGPMLGRLGEVKLPLPGGDVIGARRVDTHFEAIEALGARLSLEDEIYGQVKDLKGCEIFLDEPSVTATENALLLAVKAKGTTILFNAACEPHVVGLCNLLNSMGAKISGIGTNRVEIQGVEKLHGATHTIGADFMEVGSFLCLGAMATGRIEILNTGVKNLNYILKTFKRIGIVPQIRGEDLIMESKTAPAMKTDISGRVGSIYSGPWPAFPTDLMSVGIVAATQAKGTMIFHEKMFEGRMFFTDKLMTMGANIVLCDPHRVVVTGPSPLRASRMSSPDVRAGMALLMAAVVAEGTSEIHNTYQIERGYYNIDVKLKNLGVNISKKISSDI